jgi:hypothetical protein
MRSKVASGKGSDDALVNDRCRAEPFRQLDQRKAGSTSDVERRTDVRQRHMFEQQKAEHRRPKRQLVVRRDHLWRIEVGFEVEELRLVDGRHNGEPRG